MTSTLKISLKANDKIYINGAVVRVDRKVSLEFLNDVQFLLQHHVLQAEDATTPLRQLYFAVQLMLIDPETADRSREEFRKMLARLLAILSDERLLAGLKHVDALVSEDQVYEALKVIRSLYPLEAELLQNAGTQEEIAEIALPRAVGQ